jgi:hypothetical protein
MILAYAQWAHGRRALSIRSRALQALHILELHTWAGLTVFYNNQILVQFGSDAHSWHTGSAHIADI